MVSVLGRARRALHALAETARASGATALDAVRDAFADLGASASEGAQDAVAATSDALVEAGGAVVDRAQDVLEFGREALEDMADLVRDEAPELAQEVAETVQDVGGKARDVLEETLDVGKAVANLPGLLGPALWKSLEEFLTSGKPSAYLGFMDPHTIDKAEGVPKELYEPVPIELRPSNKFVGFLMALIATFTFRGPLFRTIERESNLFSPNAIPPVSDVVRFELRDVFRSNIRESLLEEPPSDTFLAFMRGLGYAPEMAKHYWAAHWELPSVGQGFEMFHRLRPGAVAPGVAFTLPDLKRLLKQQDVLPFYRDRLTEIAYAPYTRVDVRRMFQAGVLSFEEVVSAYRDLGYDATRATTLAEWTRRDLDTEERTLTLSQVLSGYKEGLLARLDAATRLQGVGYSVENVEFFLSLLDKVEGEREEREGRLRRVKLLRLQRKFLTEIRKDVFDLDLAEAELENLGLQPSEVEAFIRVDVLGAVRPAATEEARELSRGQVLEAYRQGVIPEEEARRRLQALRYDVRDVDVSIAVAKSKGVKEPGE